DLPIVRLGCTYVALHPRTDHTRLVFSRPWLAWLQACRASASGAGCAAREHLPTLQQWRAAAGDRARAGAVESWQHGAISLARRRAWLEDRRDWKPRASVSARRVSSP